MQSSLMNHATRRIADAFIELFDFIGRSAEVFQNPGPSFDAFNTALFEPAELLRFALKWSRVNLRARNRHVQFENVIRSPAIALFQNHIDAVRITEMIDPSSVVPSSTRDNTRVTIPTTGRRARP